MAALFSKPKMPSIPEPQPIPETPKYDQAAEAQSAEDELRKRRGRAANIVMGQSKEDLNNYDVGRKTLLGA
jgi:hypothetical protein